MILFHCTIFLIFCFSIRNFNSFCSSFYYRNWPENSHHHAYSMQHPNKKRPIFSTNMLIPGTTLIKNGSSFPPPRLFRATHLFWREEYLTIYMHIYIYIFIYIYIEREIDIDRYRYGYRYLYIDICNIYLYRYI